MNLRLLLGRACVYRNKQSPTVSFSETIASQVMNKDVIDWLQITATPSQGFTGTKIRHPTIALPCQVSAVGPRASRASSAVVLAGPHYR